AYGVVAYAPKVAVGPWSLEIDPRPGRVSWADLVFGSVGLMIVGMAARAGWQLVRGGTSPHNSSSTREGDTDSKQALAGAGGFAEAARHDVGWFLVGWLVLEVAGYFVLSPFPATRRVLGLIVAITILIGYWLSRAATPTTRGRAWAVACFGV